MWNIASVVENQMDKNMEDEMKLGLCMGFIGLILKNLHDLSIPLNPKPYTVMSRFPKLRVQRFMQDV